LGATLLGNSGKNEFINCVLSIIIFYYGYLRKFSIFMNVPRTPGFAAAGPIGVDARKAINIC
jgi:hypothetical protein